MSKIRLINWISIKRNDIIDFILITSAFLSIWSYYRFIPIIVYLINFFTFKRHLKASFLFFTIALGLTALRLILNPIVESDFKKATRCGFREDFESESKKTLNILSQHINDYKQDFGHFPKTLKEVQKNSMIKDVSYNLIEGNLEHPYYYYEIIDKDSIYLSGIGKDGLPKTKDDLLPEFNDNIFDTRQYNK